MQNNISDQEHPAQRVNPEETKTGPSSIEKTGTTFMIDQEMTFSYRVQSTASKSPLLKREITLLRDGKGIMGVMFPDDTIAWSRDSVRHVSLEKCENKEAIARFETKKSDFVINNPHPQIHIFGKGPNEVRHMTEFLLEKCDLDEKTPIIIDTANNMSAEQLDMTTWRRLFMGYKKDLDPTKLTGKEIQP